LFAAFAIARPFVANAAARDALGNCGRFSERNDYIIHTILAGFPEIADGSAYSKGAIPLLAQTLLRACRNDERMAQTRADIIFSTTAMFPKIMSDCGMDLCISLPKIIAACGDDKKLTAQVMDSFISALPLAEAEKTLPMAEKTITQLLKKHDISLSVGDKKLAESARPLNGSINCRLAGKTFK